MQIFGKRFFSVFFLFHALQCVKVEGDTKQQGNWNDKNIYEMLRNVCPFLLLWCE